MSFSTINSVRDFFIQRLNNPDIILQVISYLPNQGQPNIIYLVLNPEFKDTYNLYIWQNEKYSNLGILRVSDVFDLEINFSDVREAITDLQDNKLDKTELLAHNNSILAHPTIKEEIGLLEARMTTQEELGKELSIPKPETDPIYMNDKPLIALKSELVLTEANIRKDINSFLDGLPDWNGFLEGLPKWNSVTYDMTFTRHDGATLVLNLSALALTYKIDFDYSTNEIIFINPDNTKIRINISHLIDVYKGSIGSNIQISISSQNEITATLLAGSVELTQLTTALQTLINGKLNTSTFNTHDTNNTRHITAAERTAWNNKQNSIPANTYAPFSHVGATGTEQHDLANGTAAGFSNDTFTTAEKTKLAGIAANATANTGTITGVTAGNGLTGGGTSGGVTVTMGAPSSCSPSTGNGVTAQSHTHTITGVEASITAGTTAQYWRGDKTFQTLNAAAVGLGNVNNTSDANKPVSTATQNALNLKADIASPALTGTPTAPTAAVGTNTTQIATTAFVQANTGTVTQVSAGNGMNFTAITGTGSVALRTPVAITASSTNTAGTTSAGHTHQLTSAATTGGSLKGRNANTAGQTSDLTPAQVRTMLNIPESFQEPIATTDTVTNLTASNLIPTVAGLRHSFGFGGEAGGNNTNFKIGTLLLVIEESFLFTPQELNPGNPIIITYNNFTRQFLTTNYLFSLPPIILNVLEGLVVGSWAIFGHFEIPDIPMGVRCKQRIILARRLA